MKITITREFDSAEAAMDWIQRDSYYQAPQVLDTRINTTEGVEPALPAEARLGGRKPRSDAGKPRGPYSKAKKVKTPAAEAPAVTETPERSEPAVEEAPAKSAAPEQAITPAPESAAPAAADLTIDNVKAEMVKLARKHGIEANMKLLGKFGTAQVSKLPQDQYAAFIEAVKAATASTVAP